jgi:CRISPR-associated protein Cas2
MAMIRVLVAYDTSNDKSRKKMSDFCLDYGLDRYQYSFFTGILKPVQFRGLAKALKPFAKDGHITLIPVSSDDWEKRIELGEGKLPDDR